MKLWSVVRYNVRRDGFHIGYPRFVRLHLLYKRDFYERDVCFIHQMSALMLHRVNDSLR